MKNESFSILYRKFTFEHCLTKLNNLMRFYKFGDHWFKITKENIPEIQTMNGGNLFPSFLKSLNPNLALKWTHIQYYRVMCLSLHSENITNLTTELESFGTMSWIVLQFLQKVSVFGYLIWKKNFLQRMWQATKVLTKFVP